MIAIDANFRLKRRAVSNEERDPASGSGLGYFVEDEKYRETLKRYVDQEEVSVSFHTKDVSDPSADQYVHRLLGAHERQYKVFKGICGNRCWYVRLRTAWVRSAERSWRHSEG